jgi:hypothetical protein
MYQDLNKSTALANSYSAMEPETIQKNGASPKSQTSRGNFGIINKQSKVNMKNLFFTGFAAVLFSVTVVSCEQLSTCECTIIGSYKGQTVYSNTITREDYDGSCQELESSVLSNPEVVAQMESIRKLGGSMNVDCREK